MNFWDSFKKWLTTCDNDGLTGFDAIFGFCWNCLAFIYF